MVKPPSLHSLLALPAIRAVCVSQFMLGFIAACFNAAFVLMGYTAIKDGGMGLSVRPAHCHIALCVDIDRLVLLGYANRQHHLD